MSSCAAEKLAAQPRKVVRCLCVAIDQTGADQLKSEGFDLERRNQGTERLADGDREAIRLTHAQTHLKRSFIQLVGKARISGFVQRTRPLPS
jgi:hypothetical protein